MMLSVIDTELWLSAVVETEDTVGACSISGGCVVSGTSGGCVFSGTSCRMLLFIITTGDDGETETGNQSNE